MKELKVGDKIVDVRMSLVENSEIVCDVVGLCNGSFIVDSGMLPSAYSHRFYHTEYGSLWEYK